MDSLLYPPSIARGEADNGTQVAPPEQCARPGHAGHRAPQEDKKQRPQGQDNTRCHCGWLLMAGLFTARLRIAVLGPTCEVKVEVCGWEGKQQHLIYQRPEQVSTQTQAPHLPRRPHPAAAGAHLCSRACQEMW